MGHREAPLVGLSPTGQSMGHSGPTCGSQLHRPIYGAQWVYLWVSAPQAEVEDGEQWGEAPHVWGGAVGRGGIPGEAVTEWGPAALWGRPTDSAP